MDATQYITKAEYEQKVHDLLEAKTHDMAVYDTCGLIILVVTAILIIAFI